MASDLSTSAVDVELVVSYAKGKNALVLTEALGIELEAWRVLADHLNLKLLVVE